MPGVVGLRGSESSATDEEGDAVLGAFGFVSWQEKQSRLVQKDHVKKCILKEGSDLRKELVRLTRAGNKSFESLKPRLEKVDRKRKDTENAIEGFEVTGFKTGSGR